MIKNRVLPTTTTPGGFTPHSPDPHIPWFLPCLSFPSQKAKPELEISGLEEHFGSLLTLINSPFKFQEKVAKLGLAQSLWLGTKEEGVPHSLSHLWYPAKTQNDQDL